MPTTSGTHQDSQHFTLLRKSLSAPELTKHKSKTASFAVEKTIQSDQKRNLENSKTHSKSLTTFQIKTHSPDQIPYDLNSGDKKNMTENTKEFHTHDLIVHKTTAEQFTDWDKEKQSLGVRALFETASSTVFIYSKESDCDKVENLFKDTTSRHAGILLFGCVETGKEVSYKLISNDQEVMHILSNYNENLFKQTEEDQQMPMILDNTYAVTVSPDVIMRYTTSSRVARLPHIETVLQNSRWRKDPELLTSTLSQSRANPDIVLRGVIQDDDRLVSPGYFYCDAHNAITQQLINFQRTRPSNPLKLSFPAMEGRGGVFSIGGVPFHQYNSRSYNDYLCAHLGIFINTEEAFRPVLKVPEGVSVVELTPQKHHSMVPAIKSRQEQPIPDYIQVLMMTLVQYIISSLEYQRALPRCERIPKPSCDANTEKSTDIDIENAITRISGKTFLKCPTATGTYSGTT
ncbi:hypothetical protein GCM10023116_48080 [Kistimonas scapharcae]|uniref:Uncharacterized protein n=1 Tax=Kistimonas scapharcae TaxID=1036133 RepID=A0ABP8V995_9GAMM